ncbi:MAG: nuclear transport factor 2 family protein [Calditrichaceae bacterium]|jgi:hypothetical protein
MKIDTKIFEFIDNKDTDGFLSYFTDNSSFKFANADASVGLDNIRQTLNYFFNSIKSLKHELLDTWTHPDSLIFSGNVTYTRLNDTILSVPFVTIIKLAGEKVKDYLIYVDASELYQ